MTRKVDRALLHEIQEVRIKNPIQLHSQFGLGIKRKKLSHQPFYISYRSSRLDERKGYANIHGN